MKRVKLSILDDNGKTLCKIGSSIDDPADLEYTDKELADALIGMAYTLNESYKHRSDAPISKLATVLGAESTVASGRSSNVTAILLEAQEAPLRKH